MKKIFVTTFNKQLYDRYAYKLIQTYLETQQTLPLYCYVDDDINLYPKFKNVIFMNLFEHQPENKKFITRNKKKFGNLEKKIYLLDALRFSYKVFAQNDARKYGDHIFYIDSDTYFVNKIPDEWFNECLPEDIFISFYERLGFYTECGFLAFNNNIIINDKIKLSDLFFNVYVNYYINDGIYFLPSFTDCHALDATRYRFLFFRPYFLDYKKYSEKRLGDLNLWRSTSHLDVMKTDSFINNYIIHSKGLKKFEKSL